MSTQVFTLPDLGEGLTEAELVRWLVAAGDPIAVDAPIAEIETAKSMVEVPSPFGGVVRALHGDEGSTIVVGAPLISVDDLTPADPPAAGPAVAPTGGSTAPDSQDPAALAYRAEERAGSGNVLIGYGTSVDSIDLDRKSEPLNPGRGGPTYLPTLDHRGSSSPGPKRGLPVRQPTDS